MLLNKTSFTIISASLLLGIAPTFAGEISTTSNQVTIIKGSGNYANSESYQSVTNSNNGNSGSNTGVSLENQQVCAIIGNNNNCINRIQQKVEIRGYIRSK
jgi:hypothetical protein